jgi:hypothetical protein
MRIYTSTWTLATACCLLTSLSVSAEEAQGPFYNGSFVEFSGRLGATGGAGLRGWTADIGIRHSFPMHLLDSRIAFRHDELGASEMGARVQQESFGVTTSLHPLYLFLLGSDRWSYTLASTHLELGSGIDAVTRAGNTAWDIGLYLSIGGGFDIPLHDPDTGSGLWVNVLYRYHLGDWEENEVDNDLSLHTLFVGLAWRNNGVLF